MIGKGGIIPVCMTTTPKLNSERIAYEPRLARTKNIADAAPALPMMDATGGSGGSNCNEGDGQIISSQRPLSS